MNSPEAAIRFDDLRTLAGRLAAGDLSSRVLVDHAARRIEAAGEDGQCSFTALRLDKARAEAEAIDEARAAGATLPPFAGIPVTVKDLFDLAGEVTRAGSLLLRGAPPAAKDADAIARLRRAGFIVIGRTNMTEFAYSGLGLNPHFGTPLNAWDRQGGRIPGGSSSGAATSVAWGMAAAAIGTDTGGSCRIPAAFNGIVGFKPTASRVSSVGCFPLSATLDSVGPLANTVACCAALDEILHGGPPTTPTPADTPTIIVPDNVLRWGVDDVVGAAFEQALRALRDAGFAIGHSRIGLLDDVDRMNAESVISIYESYRHHARHLADPDSPYDPRVRARMMAGAGVSETRYDDIMNRRRALARQFRDEFGENTFLATPTVSILPPRLSELERDEDYRRLNRTVLRTTAIANCLDGASISLPIRLGQEAPVGFMLTGAHGSDSHLLALAGRIEARLRSRG
ncbi:amidase [Aquibium carbonis]|uniref:Amidase n=1 Tax=Aquibium carbonis TaxID=2495581 RepID=A0A3S0G7R0_9HYPH|nr:amidase [Aquibium carbonis]RST85712.1 amidase [Aquibium carbonis]